MELSQHQALGSGLISFRMLDPAGWDAHHWPIGGEVQLLEEQGQYLMVRNKAIVPVERASRNDVMIHLGGVRLWCLARAKGVSLALQVLECTGDLTLDLDIGVDDRILDQLHQQGHIDRRDQDLACEWLRQEFLLPYPENEQTRGRALVGNESDNQALRLIGGQRQGIVREYDGTWRLERLIPPRRNDSRPLLLKGTLDFVPIDAASQLCSAGQQQQLQEYLNAHGDYVALWQRYAGREWQQATAAGRQLGVLPYRDCRPVGDEQSHWQFQVNPKQAGDFLVRYAQLVNGDRQQSRAIEACDEAPGWLSSDEVSQAKAGRRPVVGDSPRLQGEWLNLNYDQSTRFDKPSSSGVLCLSIHGERKVHERRESALRCIHTSKNPMPQLRYLLEGQPVPLRNTWRKERALSQAARQSFHGEPTVRQRQALDMALNTPDIAIIIGPPGTGKTQVIAALQIRATELFEDPAFLKNQFMVTSFQHDAVDNALSRIRVNGLPPLRVGGRRGEQGKDPLGGWAQATASKLEPKLQQALDQEPVFQVLSRLREDMIRLRIQVLSRAKRVELARGIDQTLETLDRDHGLRPSYSTKVRWQEWFTDQVEAPDTSPADANSSIRLQWRRCIWALRTTPVSFADDGPRQCLRLLDLADCLGRPDLQEKDRCLLKEMAVQSAISTEQLSCLHDLRERLLTASRRDYRPPQLRHMLDRNGAKILDALLEELHQRLSQRPQWARLQILQDYWDQLRLNPQRIQQAVQAYASVLGATCQQSASEQMLQVLQINSADEVGFDTVVIDEAARATPLDLFIPMSMARRRIVLVGDHRQLPHLLDPATEKELEEAGDLTEAESKALGESLFERLVQGLRKLRRDHPEQPQRVITLSTQFRMHPVLGDFISRTFYEAAGEEPIKSGRPAQDFVHGVPDYQDQVCAWIDLPSTDPGSRDRKKGSSRVREVEAERIVQEAYRILTACPDLSLGIITFYAAQRDLILEKLAALGLSEHQEGTWRIRSQWRLNQRGEERLCVGSVDAFQGKEFDVVLLSIVRTDSPLYGEQGREQALTRKYGFLRVANRLNVAMSRQRRLLIAIGDAALARAPETREAAPGLAAFMELCEGSHGTVL